MFQFDFVPALFSDINRWAIYTHSEPGHAEPLWIGYCRVGDLLTPPDARGTPAWHQIAASKPQMRLQVLALVETELEALRGAARLVKTHRPVINTRAGAVVNPDGRQVRVLCLDTGVEYASAADAARAVGCYPSQMSAHLSRTSGSSRVKGKRFVKL